MCLLSERRDGEASEGGGGEDAEGNYSLLFPRGNQLGASDRVPQVRNSCLMWSTQNLKLSLWLWRPLLLSTARPSPLSSPRSTAAEETDTAGGYWSVKTEASTTECVYRESFPNVSLFNLQPGGKGARPPEAYCIISSLACFGLFSKVSSQILLKEEMAASVSHSFRQRDFEKLCFPLNPATD